MASDHLVPYRLPFPVVDASVSYAARMASQTDTLIGGGGALATVGGVLVGVGIAENAGSHHTVWSNPWFDVGCALLACGLVLVLGALTTSWLRSHPRHRTSVPPSEPITITVTNSPPVTMQTREHVTPSPPPSPLHLTLVDETWRLIYDAIWVFSLAIRVTNLTEKPVMLTQYYLQPHSGTGPRPPLDPKVWDSVNTLLKRLRTNHRSELFTGEITVPPLGSVTRWYVHTSYIPLPDGGRPHCTFGMKDTLDNEYRLDIPARAPETYQS